MRLRQRPPAPRLPLAQSQRSPARDVAALPVPPHLCPFADDERDAPDSHSTTPMMSLNTPVNYAPSPAPASAARPAAPVQTTADTGDGEM